MINLIDQELAHHIFMIICVSAGIVWLFLGVKILIEGLKK